MYLMAQRRRVRSYLCTIWREYKISLEMDKVQKLDFWTTGISQYKGF